MSTKETISTIYGTHKTEQRHLYGIEIEVEGGRGDYRVTAPRGWKVTVDGSLQDGVEFISSPASPTGVSRLLDRIDEHLKSGGFTSSFRCGVHVHYNVGNWTFKQLTEFYKYYLAFENVLFALHPNRMESLFCVPLSGTEFPRKVKEYLAHSEDAVLRFTRKYTALNFEPATRLGTMEFRHMAGTTDVAEIRNWITVITDLVELSKKKEFSVFMQEIQQESDYHPYLVSVVGEGYPQEFLRYFKRGIRNAKVVL